VITKQPVLVMIQGPEPGSFFKLPDNRLTTIGRSSRNTIRAVSNSVSRFHCEIAWVNGRWELNDLNSKKGTIVNGLRIDEKHVLRPGDIVRLSTTVFRFDMIDESNLQDGAMMAIVEAEMDVKFAPKGEAAGSLEDIRARSRQEVQDARGRRRNLHVPLKPNLIFLAASAVVVGLVVTVLLVVAHRRAGARAAGARAQAEALYRDALAVSRNGAPADAVEALRDVERRFPGTATAAAAADSRADIVWTTAEEKLALAPHREAENNHAAALQLYDEIEALGPDQDLLDVVRTNREYTIRLARARFAAVQLQAELALQVGRREAALTAYRQARDHIGVPELTAKAEQKIAELESAG
jgi:hypothetical protein